MTFFFIKPFLSKFRFFLFGFVLVAIGLSRPAATAEIEPISLAYDVSIRGIRVSTIDLKIDLKPQGYDATLETDTVGLIGWFFDEAISSSASGAFINGKPRAAHYHLEDSKGSRTKLIDVDWSGREVRTRRSYTLDSKRASAIRKVLKPDMFDPISTTLSHALEAENISCKGKRRVYDGKEVFDLEFKFLQADTFGAGDAGVYRGPSFVCRVAYKPVAGQSKRKLERIAKNPIRYRVWFAPVYAQSLGRKLILPVAATGKIKGYDAVIVTRAATIGGKPLNEHSPMKR